MSEKSLLKERVKELTCLYNISNLNEHELTVDELLQKAVKYLPEAMKYPDCAEACITFKNGQYRTKNFEYTQWILSEINQTLRNEELSVHIVYLREVSGQNGSTFLDEEMEMIRSVAYQLSLKIDRITSKNELLKRRRLLNKSYELSEIGTWELDVQESKLYWSTFIKELHGVDPEVNLTLDEGFSLVREGESRETIKKAVSNAIEHGEPFDIEVELITATDKTVWARIVGEAEFADDSCIRLYGTLQNIQKMKMAEMKLKDRNRFIEAAVENLPIGIAVNRIDNGNLEFMNHKFSEIYGWPKEDLSDVESFFENVYPDKEYREEVKKGVLDDIESGDMSRMEWEGIRITTKKGNEKIIKAKNIPVYDQNLMISTVVDITEHKRVEEQLIKNEKRFKALVQEGSDLLAIFDSDGVYKYVSPTSENILGIKPEHFIGKGLLEFIHEKDKTKIMRVINHLPEMKRFRMPPTRFRDVNYQWRWLETTITNMINEPAVQGYVANSRDITNRIKQQEKLKESLEEKEVLLSEIHHRVKNNLAIISGILQLQAYDEVNDQVIERLYDSIFRIQTMASIHELLYQTENFSRLLFSEIIEKLVHKIDETLKGDKTIDVHISISNHELNINQAIPCSLIINEVITNIYKHAFKNRNSGTINVKNREEVGMFVLEIQDDGVGLPDEFNVEDTTSLGMNIIRILSTQLEADYEFISNGNGTIFRLTFKKKDR